MPKEEGYLTRGLIRDEFVKETAAERLVRMVLAKVKGEPFESEMAPTAFAPVPMPPAIQDLSKAKLMLITDGGLVPKGNPDKIQVSAATRWGSYNIENCDDLRGEDYEISHGGYDPQFVCQDPDRLVPLDAIRELEKAGVIGKLHDEFLATSGLANPLSNTRRMGRAMAEKAKALGIDGVILTSTIVGGELSLATGAALSQTMGGGDGIVACFFGDGAACEGVFHESLNLAAVWELPILYVCENNQWQAFVHRRETMPIDHVSTWAAAHGMEALTVDGNDVEAVYAAATRAVAAIRTTGKPFFLETYTFRMHGHMEADDQSYVDRQELAAWAAKDPIQRQKERLLREGLLSAEVIAQMETRVRSTIESAVAFAGSSPYPELAELTTEIYA